jgi:hypothetical protein
MKKQICYSCIFTSFWFQLSPPDPTCTLWHKQTISCSFFSVVRFPAYGFISLVDLIVLLAPIHSQPLDLLFLHSCLLVETLYLKRDTYLSFCSSLPPRLILDPQSSVPLYVSYDLSTVSHQKCANALIYAYSPPLDILVFQLDIADITSPPFL